jgi:hypothetical protein
VAKTADGYRFGKIFTGPKLTISSAENRNRALDLLKRPTLSAFASRALGVHPDV